MRTPTPSDQACSRYWLQSRPAWSEPHAGLFAPLAASLTERGSGPCTHAPRNENKAHVASDAPYRRRKGCLSSRPPCISLTAPKPSSPESGRTESCNQESATREAPVGQGVKQRARIGTVASTLMP